MVTPVDADGLVEALQDTTRDLMAVALRSLDAADSVGLRHMRLLLTINDQGETSCTALAGALGISGSTVTRLADHLERSGHLTRRPHPDNRSVIILKLTDRGGSAVGDVLRWRAQVFERISAPLEPEVRARTAEGLRALHALLAAEIAVGFSDPSSDVDHP